MINAANIAAYIRFLYQQKYQAPAPAEVIDSWSQLPEEEIPGQLQALYDHWGLDADAAAHYEQVFVSESKKQASAGNFFAPPPGAQPDARQQAAVHPTPVNPAYTPPPENVYSSVQPPKSNAWKTIAIVAVVLLLIAGGIFAYQSYQNQNPDTSTLPPTTDTTMAYTQPTPTPLPEPEPMVADLALDELDQYNIDVIHQLLAAEDEQNLEAALSYYAPYMERYWDISYPTEAQLQKRYEDSWQKVADARNTVTAVRKIAPLTYDTDISYTFYQIAKDTTNTVNSTLRFVFNENHQVSQVYKLK